jgi:cobalt-zinc-cadmium efflux system membrane fusion protein
MSAATILLVDDDEVLRQVLRRVLTREGYTVVEAGTVAQALERAQQQRPALGLIDLRLPDGDGVELAQKLQQKVGRFPLILMTAYPLRLRDQPELARGFAHILTKPLNLDELRQAISSSLGTAPASSVAAEPRSSSSTITAPAPPAELPAPAAPAAPPAETPSPKSRRRWVIASVVLVLLAGLAVAVPALGTPAVQRFLNPTAAPVQAPILESHASLVTGYEDEIELPREVIERLGVLSEPVQTAVTPRTLELAGSLSFDPNRLFRIQARFAGEVIALGTLRGHSSTVSPDEPVLRYGDRVSKGQLMAVVYSKDLGEKKSELIDSLVRLWYDEAQLENFETLVKEGSIPAVTVRTQRTAVATDRNAVGRVELTLRTWRVSPEEIQAVKDEAQRVFERKGERDIQKETEWAKVEVRAPFEGTIVEKNVALGNIVSTDFDMYKVADLRKLGVLVHAYEEDLRELRRLRPGHPWKVRTTANVNAPELKSDGIQQLGFIVDPSQHTDPVMGLVDNTDGYLRVGQFVKATVELPAPPNVVSVPASAIVEDGAESIVFVQPDPAKPQYAQRRVAVAMRLRDVVYVRSELNEKERQKGLKPLKPGEYIVTEGVLELQSALEDLQAKAKAKK